MALWQYTFHVVPKESLDALSQRHPLQHSEDGFVEEPYWDFKPVSRTVFKEIGRILQETPSWSKSIDQYGNLESNCFEVLHEGEVIDSLYYPPASQAPD